MQLAFLLLLTSTTWPFPATTAINDVYEGDEAQKMLFLHMIEAVENYKAVDFEKISNVLVMPDFRKAVEDANLQGFSDFLQELSSQELQELSQIFSKPRREWSVGKVTEALGEGNNWVWFPKTAKFGWYGWSFVDWIFSIGDTYQVELSYSMSDNTLMPMCPCRLCIKHDNACIDLTQQKAEILIKNL